MLITILEIDNYVSDKKPVELHMEKPIKSHTQKHLNKYTKYFKTGIFLLWEEQWMCKSIPSLEYLYHKLMPPPPPPPKVFYI